jgi:two-component system response regulator YesN
LGDRFGYAPNYLNEIVTRTTGRSLLQWQIGFRMEMARQLLKTPRLHASRVAIEIGMDAPHFTRSFATRYGMTPSTWRKSVFGGTNIDPLIDEINASGVVSIAE